MGLNQRSTPSKEKQLTLMRSMLQLTRFHLGTITITGLLSASSE